MSTSDSTVKGKFNEAVGNVKQGIGEAVSNESLANEGAAEQVKGHAQEAWGSVKEGFTDATNDRKPVAQAEAHEEAHDVREKITSTAQNVKEHIEAGIDSLRSKKAS